MENKAIKNGIGKRKSSRTKSVSHVAGRNGVSGSLRSIASKEATAASLSAQMKRQTDREDKQASATDADTHHIASMVGKHNDDAAWGRIFANIRANRRKLAKLSKVTE